VADGHIEIIDSFVYLGSIIDSTGGNMERERERERERDPASDRIGTELHEPAGKNGNLTSDQITSLLEL